MLDEIRNSNINDALAKLSFMNKKAANNIHKTITSAINNQDFLSYLYFLGAILAVGIPGLCLATVEAIYINND